MESLREQDRQDVYIGQRGSIDFDICLDPVMREIRRRGLEMYRNKAGNRSRLEL